MDFAIALPTQVIPALIVVLTAIMVDVVFGVMLHLINGTFDFRLMSKFMCSDILPYVGGLLVLAVAAELVGVAYRELFFVVAGLILFKFVPDIKDKLLLIFKRT